MPSDTPRPLTEQERTEVEVLMEMGYSDLRAAIEALVRRCGDAEAETRAHAKWAKEFTATDEHGKLWLDMIRQRDAALARAERAEAERDEARRCAEGMRNRYANALATYRDHWSTAVGDPAFAASQEADMETDLAAVHRLPWERPGSSQDDAGDLPPEGYVRCNRCHAMWPLGGGHVCSPASGGAGA